MLQNLNINQILAEINKNLLELAAFMSMLGEQNKTVLKLAVDNITSDCVTCMTLLVLDT